MIIGKTRDGIPKGWQLMNLQMLGKYRSLARKVIGRKGRAMLQEGWNFYGYDYDYHVTKSGRRSHSSYLDQLLIREEGILLDNFKHASSSLLINMTSCLFQD